MENTSTENIPAAAPSVPPYTAPYAAPPPPKKPGIIARTLKRIITILLLLIIGYALIWGWYIRERIADLHLEDTVKEEVSRVEGKLDERGNAIETKLDRIEGKLDRLLYLLEPRLPDGMAPIE